VEQKIEFLPEISRNFCAEKVLGNIDASPRKRDKNFSQRNVALDFKDGLKGLRPRYLGRFKLLLFVF
jgi:hypothetical protein